jgi:DNA repair protein RecO (recombination protein O)
MIHKVKGVVLHHIKYKESSAIVHVYTDLYGRQAYLINNIRGRRSKYSGNLLQSLTLLEIEAYHKEGKDLQHVKEISNYIPYRTIPFDMHKNSQTLFLAEVLYKALREEDPNAELFKFLENSLQLLDVSEEGMANFHLLFLVQLTKYLGFYPDNNFAEKRTGFDMQNGQFSTGSGLHSEYFDKGSGALLNTLLDCSFTRLSEITVKQEERQKFLENIMDYYKLHIQSFGNIKSLAVLQEIYREKKNI